MTGSSYYLDPDLYDVVYAGIVADIEPHLALLRAARGKVLEVCCGHGRLLVPALEAGLASEGLDLDPRMLDALRERLAARRLTAKLHQADMRDFSLTDRYELIVIAFNSFLHNLTQADQLKTLRNCHRHLGAGGRLVLNVFHPSLEKLMQWSGVEQVFKDAPHEGGRVKVWDIADDDRVEQIRRITRRIEFHDPQDQIVRREIVNFSLRYIWKPEMELLLRVAGFPRWEARPLAVDHTAAGALPDRPIREGDIVQWTAWKD